MDQISGFLNIYKPSGPTSHDVVNRLRKITGIKKIGHAGTLDPFASGVLICAIGRAATKEINQFVKLDKKYIAQITLGKQTNTFDRTGDFIDNNLLLKNIKEIDIRKCLESFLGKQKQIPPMFSAKKIKGKKLYELARAGIEIKREKIDIEIFDIKLLKYSFPSLEILVHAISGTYIRSLASDIGRSLGYGAYLEELERTAIGNIKIEDSINLEEINKDNLPEFFLKK